MAGPATNASSIAIIKNILGNRTLYHYLALIGITALGFGFVLDTFLTIDISAIRGQHHAHDMGGTGTLILTIIFIAVLVNAYGSRFRTTDKGQNEQTYISGGEQEEISLTVEGMTCSHCKESVEGAIHSIPGVERSWVDLPSGSVRVAGKNIDAGAMRERIMAKGFTIKD